MEKISIENPYAILTSGTIGLCLNMMDFFEITTQKKILSMTLNVSRHSASEQDFNDQILPLLPCLCMLLQTRGDHAQSKIEIVVNITLKVAESIMRFYSPLTHFDKVSEQYEKIGDSGIIDGILQKLQDYCVVDESMEIDLPSQMQQSTQKSLSNHTIQYTLKLLTLCSRYSCKLTTMIIDFDIFSLLSKFLPSKDDLKKVQLSSDQFPFIIETINLLETLLPDRDDEQLKSDSDKPRFILENTKRALYNSQQSSVAYYLAEKLLPKIFFVYENNMSASIRNKALQVIDKMISLFTDELLNNFIEPYSFAKFIYSNLRGNQLPSMQLCLQMVQKLMKSNAKNYTLPLMREGVTEFIKKIATKSGLESTLNIKLDQQSLQESPEKLEEFIAKAKQAMLAKAEADDLEGRAQMELSLKNYLEASRAHQFSQSNPSKSMLESSKQVLSLAEQQCKEYFDNEEFQAKLNEWYGEEFKNINMLKNLAADIIQEAKQGDFNLDRTKNLMKQLAECLTNKRNIMNYEFKQSGLLEAISLFLTQSPKQVQAHCDKQKMGEEMKENEEMMMSQQYKNASQITKKEARCYLQRLKVFAHVVLSNFNNKKPIQELVNLCHDQLSQCEHEIFNLQTADPNAPGNLFGQPYGRGGNEDPNQSVHALRQLTKRSRVHLVYDPNKNFMKRETLAAMTSKDAQGLLQPPKLGSGGKANSHHPAFLVLGGEKNIEDQPHSKVYLKRNFLYNELQQVLISVEQCASLWLLEDFLRNKIRTVEDVKNLKQPQSYYSQMKRGSSSLQQSPICRQMLERAMDQMRDILESGSGRDQMRTDGEEFAERFSQELVDNKELTEVDQVEIIKSLEVQVLQLMDDYYADQEGSQYEDVHRDDLMEESDDMNAEQKILELQKIVEMVRLFFRNKKIDADKAKEKKIQADADMKQEQQPVPNNLEEEIQKLKQPQLAQEEEKKNEQSEESKREDVEMTDEEGDEQKKIKEIIEKKMSKQTNQREVELSIQDPQIKEMDLDDLIKAAGDDIEFEFYFNGVLVAQNQTIFEILKQADAKANDLLTQAVPGYRSEASITVHFLIKDKRDELNMQRKDSLLDFAARRERTKSEAVEDISVSAVNSLVNQLFEKEFQVFAKGTSLESAQSDELKYLEQALKVLKVLNYICKNIQLLSEQGMNFIINARNQEEEKDEVFSDIALQIGLSELQANIFHHHKLDTFILKNIQDPYTLIGGGISDTLQQIFRNCPFLFPFQTRLLFFQLISFIGSIDMNRSIFFLRQFLKHRLGKLPQEDKNNAVKFQKQKVIIDRNRILDSAHSLMKQINKRAFLEIQYKEEQGTGLGPTLEFYYLVSSELREAEVNLGNARVGIWRKGMVDNSMFPSPISIPTLRTDELQKVYEIFRLTGMMIAKSISDDRLIDLPISPLMWDLALGKKMNLFDLERIDKDLFKIFADLQMLANRKRDLDKQVFLDQESKTRQLNTLRTSSGARVEDLTLTFTLPGFDNIELKQNGRAIDVTLGNLQEYIDLVMHFTFHETIKIQVSAFKKGFNAIFPIDTLKPFSTTNELEDMICGVQRNDEEWTNVARLTESVVPAHGYHTKSNEYIELLQFMSELDHEERRKFLKFVTGSPRLPNGGFAALDPKLTVVLKKPIYPNENPDDILPSVMTCQNYIKLPSYSSYEKLKARFQMAYNEGTNNFTLS